MIKPKFLPSSLISFTLIFFSFSFVLVIGFVLGLNYQKVPDPGFIPTIIPTQVPSPTSELIPTQSQSQLIPSETKPVGYITRFYKKNSSYYLDIDYVDWLGGVEATTACIRDKKCPPENAGQLMPDDYYISNVNKKIRTFPIGADANILVLKNGSELYRATLEEFNQLFNHPAAGQEWFKELTFEIGLANNIVTSITQRYQP